MHKHFNWREINGTNLSACDIKEMNKRRLDVLKLETNYFGSNKHSLLPTGKRTVWLLWKWRGYSGKPGGRYLRKRRKDIFGPGGSEIPRPCIRRPVAMKVHLIPAEIIHRPAQWRSPGIIQRRWVYFNRVTPGYSFASPLGCIRTGPETTDYSIALDVAEFWMIHWLLFNDPALQDGHIKCL